MSDNIKALPARTEPALWPSVLEEIESAARKMNVTQPEVGDGAIRSYDNGFVNIVWPVGYGRFVGMHLSANVIQVLIDGEWRNLARLEVQS